MGYKRKTNRRYTRHKAERLPDRFEPGFLTRLDQRTALAMLLKDRFDVVCDDLGGEAELSHLQRALVERATFMEALLQDMEADMAAARQNGDATRAGDVLGKWTQCVNAYVGLCARLGLKRQRKQVDLRTYVATNGLADSPGDLEDK
jgi:hypothetical protein